METRAKQIKFEKGWGYSDFPYSNVLGDIAKAVFHEKTFEGDSFFIGVKPKGKPYCDMSGSQPENVFCKVFLIDQAKSVRDWQPSETTIAFLQDKGLPCAEMSRITGTFRVFYPEWYQHREPKLNRIYKILASDCYTLVREYMVDVLKIEVPEASRAEAKRHADSLGRDFIEQVIESYGFERVLVPMSGDIVLIHQDMGEPTHMAVMTDDENILHLAPGRLSCIEKYAGYWKAKTTSIWRAVNV